MKILLGKKLKLVIFGLLLVIAIGFLASRTSNVSYVTGGILSTGNLSDKMHTKALRSVTKKDSDKDGLKDWEEELWGTDPHKKDTDRDGTDDGEEVNLGRNPNIAGPDDELDGGISTPSQQDYSKEENTEFTATEKFSRYILENYLYTKGLSNTPLTEEDKNNLVSLALQNVSDLTTKIQQYTTSDLLISKNTDRIDLINYGNALGNIIKKYSFETKSSVLILEDSLENNDPNEIEKLDPVIDGYKNILNDFLEISVPENAAEEHLNTVNALAFMIDVIESMRVFYEDPIRALAGLGQYPQGSSLLRNSFQDMKKFFSDRNIVFEKKDGGYVLINII